MNEPSPRADPGSAPPGQYRIFIRNTEGLEENSVIQILGRTLELLGAIRISRKGSLPFFGIKLIPKAQESPPPGFRLKPSTSSSKGLLSEKTSIGLRDSSRELASTEVHHPSQSRITHEIPQSSHGGVDRRSNRDILLSVERSSMEKRFLAGSV